MSDLLNKNPIDLVGKIQILTPTGHFNVDRYPWADQAWEQQQRIHWLGEEVPMGDDISDWAGSKITDNERSLLTQIFRFFTQSDICVCENYAKRMLGVFQPLEIQNMLIAFMNMETIHVKSYSLLINTLGMPETEFKAFQEYSEMTAKVDYMDTFGMSTCRDVAKTLAMFGAFTEGLSLFASFSMLLNFPRQNKMKGMGQIVAFSVKDETLHASSMIKMFHAFTQECGIPLKAIQDDIIDVCKNVVMLEDKFIDLSFALGEVNGMTAQEIKSYIRYIADWRLTQLKLKPIYGFFSGDFNRGYEQEKAHPLPWLTEMLNGVEHANFFEARATEYSKASTKGKWEGLNGVWSMFNDKKKYGD